MMIKQRLTCVLLLVLIGHHDVRTASVNMESPVGVLGNNPHYVRCSFIPAAGESFILLDMNQIVNGVQTKLGGFSVVTDPKWDPSAPNDIKTRSLLIKLDSPIALQLSYNDTMCSDEKNYACSLSYGPAGGGTGSQTNSTKVTVEASPGAPTMTVAPGYNITENTTVTFTCTGNVGKPPGQFEWYMYKGSTWEDKTDKAAPQSNTLVTSSCTYTGRSSINITMTRMEQGIVMRCRVYHPTQGSNTNVDNCTYPDVNFCRNGERVSVSYPVSINISAQSSIISVDQGSDINLTCYAEGFPPPTLRWFKNSDPNSTLETSRTLKSTLTLQDLSVSDSDVYVCIGSNSINGAELNDSKQVQITVVPTTTPPPTTTSTKTTTNSKATTTASGGVTDQVQDSGVDKTAIIVGVIVPVVVIIIIVIIVVCICRRRGVKKPPVEEPPEKPFNNHSRINTIASRPDLVSSEKTYPAFDNSKAFVNEDGLTYAQLQLDNKPRSRRPLALDDSHTDYSDISMPQV